MINNNVNIYLFSVCLCDISLKNFSIKWTRFDEWRVSVTWHEVTTFRATWFIIHDIDANIPYSFLIIRSFFFFFRLASNTQKSVSSCLVYVLPIFLQPHFSWVFILGLPKRSRSFSTVSSSADLFWKSKTSDFREESLL